MNLKATEGRIVISIDIESKNSHRFSNGTTIRLERQFDNFNRRYTEPVNAIVIDAPHVPPGAEILIHHNSLHDVNRLFNYKSLSGNDTASSVRYYSIPDTECFAWRIDDNEWQPMPVFDFALRVFQPYTGIIQNIAPRLLKNILYLTTGEYKGKVCHTLVAVDYEIIFQDNGRENRLIRCRTNGDEKNQREPEVICIDHALTEKVLSGEIWVGLISNDAQPLNHSVCQK